MYFGVKLKILQTHQLLSIGEGGSQGGGDRDTPLLIILKRHNRQGMNNSWLGHFSLSHNSVPLQTIFQGHLRGLTFDVRNDPELDNIESNGHSILFN